MSGTHLNNPGVWALALATTDGLHRQAARENLVAMGGEATTILAHLLKDSHHVVRWEAALALKDLADPASAEVLVEALMDHNGDVRWVAAEGLAAIGEPAMRPLLKALLKHADSFELRDSAHVAISLLPNTDTRRLLDRVYTALMKGRSPEVIMMAAAEALEALGGRGQQVA